MKASKIIVLLGGLLVMAPICYYLLYKILITIQATELMWFLYWVYVPAAILLGTIAKLSDDKK